MASYSFSPDQLDFSKSDVKIARTSEEMAVILFTAIYARMKFLDFMSFTEEDLAAEMGDGDYDEMTKKAIGWLAQL